jgi:tRNA pseudouridine55 synthase
MKARSVNISQFDITGLNMPELEFSIECSKGTYIRSIARDLGEILGCGAYLSALRRTRIGDFSVEQAISPDEFTRLAWHAAGGDQDA